ncbi:MAG: YhcN/YlaJ family sporulation lipoprotein [Syntrophomonas sp.]
MKPARKLLLILITVLLGASLVLGGCTTSKKPYQSPGNNTTNPKVTTPAPTTPKATTPTTNNSKQLVNRVNAAAEKVSGVRKATTVVSGKMIYIGLDLNANLEKNKSAQVERNVADKIKKMEPTYTVGVASDVDTVTRIKKVSQGIAQGKPLTSFKNELENIGTRVKPRVK